MGRSRPMAIYLREGTGKTAKTYLTVKLEDAMISGYNVSDGGDKPMESITINFKKMTSKYEASPQGTGDPVVWGL